MRKLIAIALSLFISGIAHADTYYYRATTNATCGSGTVEDASETQGSSATNESVASAQSWSYTVLEDGSYAAGTWRSVNDVTVGAGGGAPTKIDVTLEHYNSACSLQNTIIGTTSSVNLTKSTFNDDVEVTGAPGAISVSTGDEITVTVVRSGTARSTDLEYDGPTTTDDSRMFTPTFTADGAGPALRRIMVQ